MLAIQFGFHLIGSTFKNKNKFKKNKYSIWLICKIVSIVRSEFLMILVPCVFNFYMCTDGYFVLGNMRNIWLTFTYCRKTYTKIYPRN